MTLKEAIEKEEALAYSFGERWKRGGEPVGDLPKLEQEHRQLAEWLKELKAYRDDRDDRDDYKTLKIKLENAEDIIRGLQEDLRDAREELRWR